MIQSRKSNNRSTQRLGKIEQAVVKALEESGGTASVVELVFRIFHPERINESGVIDWTRNYTVEEGQFVWDTLYTHAEHVTVGRAVRSLEQRNIVTTHLVEIRRFGAPRWKYVTLVRPDSAEPSAQEAQAN